MTDETIAQMSYEEKMIEIRNTITHLRHVLVNNVPVLRNRTIRDTERTINIATEAYDTLREMENLFYIPSSFSISRSVS